MGVTIIGLASEKGGVGKTTTAIHLSAYLSTLGETILADGDRLHSGRLYARAGKLPFKVIPEVAVARERTAEWVVVDSKGGLDDRELINLAQYCDLVIIPTDPEIMSLDGARQTSEVLSAHGMGERMVALLTRAKPGKRLLEARRVLAALEIPCMENSVRFSETFKDAAADGVVVRDVPSEYAKAAWADYERVGDEVLARLGLNEEGRP